VREKQGSHKYAKVHKTISHHGQQPNKNLEPLLFQIDQAIHCFSADSVIREAGGRRKSNRRTASDDDDDKSRRNLE